MIQLDYTIDNSWRSNISENRFADADPMDIHYDLFWGDISFRIDGAEFDTHWGWVPIVDFAVFLHSITTGLNEGMADTFKFTESDASITFRRIADEVEVKSNYCASAARVPYPELFAVATTFLKRVLNEVVAQYPSLAENKYIKTLFQRLPDV